ncbi:C-C motif chemokine 14-like [Manis pentadactyla]|uniref:C-C motif chemokine 14-like n=1 Tax=Manis pentadactyla TaxID=143292 RepID=UPI00255C4F19|nr:C-C motif chemokine 14-like [Manis pentadactyla]
MADSRAGAKYKMRLDHLFVPKTREPQKPLPGQLSSCSGSPDRRMKVPVAAAPSSLLLLLLPHLATALWYETELSPRGPHHPANCCFTYVTRAILRHRIKDYYETSSRCPKPGIIFITIKGYSVCANPSDNWVQDYIRTWRGKEKPRNSSEGRAGNLREEAKNPTHPQLPWDTTQP